MQGHILLALVILKSVSNRLTLPVLETHNITSECFNWIMCPIDCLPLMSAHLMLDRQQSPTLLYVHQDNYICLQVLLQEREIQKGTLHIIINSPSILHHKDYNSKNSKRPIKYQFDHHFQLHYSSQDGHHLLLQLVHVPEVIFFEALQQ